MNDQTLRDSGFTAAGPALLPAMEPDGAPRLPVLDILRGIAILGILFMNINDMGGSLWASFGDVRHLGWNAADRIAWWLREVIANGTARCMLELLFGAGMVILTDRAALAVGSRVVMKRYYLRNLLLFGFGVVHVFILLWPGDILHTYGLAAMVAFLFRRMRPRWLITIGLVAAVAQLGGAGYFGYYQTLHEQSRVAAIQAAQATGRAITADDRKLLATVAKGDVKRAKSKAETHAKIAAEDKARTGSFATWAAMQWSVTIFFESHGFELLFVLESASVMLIGAALYKLGILQGARSRGFYLRMMLIAYAVAIPLRIIGGVEQTRFDDAPRTIWATVEVAREAMTLGHIGAVCLLIGTVSGARMLQPFIAAGRTALSIYILQTIMCLWILFPPFGFALYGTLGWAGLMATALAINIALLLFANAYVRRFDIAPVEWAWRSLVEGRALPWRKAMPPPFSGELRPV